MNGWILLHKKIWLSDNWKLSKNKGNIILVWIWLLTHCDENGIVTFGRKQIAEDTGIYESSVKRAIEHIRDKMVNEVTYEPTSTYSKISILNWRLYQRKVTNQVTNNRPASDQQVTTNKEIKNKRNIYSERTLKVCEKLNIEPTNTLEEYICHTYKQYSIKVLVDTMLQWCVENNKRPTGLRLMNWIRKAVEKGELPLLEEIT